MQIQTIHKLVEIPSTLLFYPVTPAFKHSLKIATYVKMNVFAFVITGINQKLAVASEINFTFTSQARNILQNTGRRSGMDFIQYTVY